MTSHKALSDKVRRLLTSETMKKRATCHGEYSKGANSTTISPGAVFRSNGTYRSGRECNRNARSWKSLIRLISQARTPSKGPHSLPIPAAFRS